MSTTGTESTTGTTTTPDEAAAHTNADLMTRRERAVARGPFHVARIAVARARGALVWDVEHNEYIDFCGGIGLANVGHNHPRVVAAITAQAERFVHTGFHIAPFEGYVALAERLNALVPVAAPCKTVLLNSGAEAVENAVKIARVHTGRAAVVTVERGYHGRTLLAMTMTGKVRPYCAGFGPFAPEVYRLPVEPFYADGRAVSDAQVTRGCEQALAALGAFHVAPDEVACVVVEPVLGEGGFVPIHPAGLAALRAFCTEHGALLVVDEVQTGFGRTGAMLATEQLGVAPDLLTMAKSLAGGMVLSAVTGRAEVMDAPGVGAIGGTYGGSPLACAAALAVLDVLEQEDLCARARAIGETVMARFAKLANKYEILARPRGMGAMCGIEVVDPDTGDADPKRAAALCAAALERGLLIMTASGHVLRTLMPLVITEAQLHRGLDILDAAAACCADH